MNTLRGLLTEARSEIIGGLVVAAVLAVISEVGALYTTIGARPFVFGALGVLWLAYLGYVSYWIYKWRSYKIIILVANFDEPGPENYRVTDNILRGLGDALKPYDDTTIKPLGRSIKQAEGSTIARAEGEKRKAAIVIWGWYGATPKAVQVSVNFEVLHLQQYLPGGARETTGYLQTVAVSELEEFKLQVRLSQEMAYFCLVTIGVARYAAGDWDGAIRGFSEALNQVKEDIPALDQSVAYFYRGTAYLFKDEFNQAIADFDKAIELDPDLAVAYGNRGVARSKQGDMVRAIADYDKVIELDPDLAAAYGNRGNARREQGNLVGAITDFNQAIALKPDLAEAYYNLAIAYFWLGQVGRTYACLTQALAIFKEIK